MKCALIAPPWPLFNRPSIQIAALSAYLKQHIKGVEVKCFHPYLGLYQKIGASDYGAISESGWASEAMGAMAFSQEARQEKAEMVLRALRQRGMRWKEERVECILDALIEVLEELILSARWERYNLVGISASLNQLFSGLYLAKRIKEVAPSTRIVMGGASVSGLMGQSLLNVFSFLDAVVTGEGEIPLYSIVKCLKEGRDWDRAVFGGQQVQDLNDLPIPDYDDFFLELSALPASCRFTPTLPIEFSRGCFWGRCAFCNLNIQWTGYRHKSHLRMKKEVLRLLERYRCIDFAFMDNALPPKDSERFFSAMGELGLDLNFFGELRASISRETAEVYAGAGLKTVQVGIESLSNSLLARMKKGRSVIENLAAMRHLLEAGIVLDGNLILDFPDTRDEEVSETLEALKCARYLRPLRPVSFWLGYGSPVFLHPEEYGIKRIRPHGNYSILFCGRRGITTLIHDYTGTKLSDRRKWQPVRQAIKKWHRFWDKFTINDPPLTYRDGGSVLVVRQALGEGIVLHHRFTGVSRKIFLAMLEPIELDIIFTRYDNISKDRVLAFLRDLVQKQLVYCDGVKALALPVRKK